MRKHRARRIDDGQWVEGYYMVININDELVDVIFTGSGYTLDKIFISRSWVRIDRNTLKHMEE
jgi:hypothetical protein